MNPTAANRRGGKGTGTARIKTADGLDIRSLLAAYDKAHILYIKKLEFIGVEGKDIYNITSPFLSAQREYIAGRVEMWDDEFKSRVMFFIKQDEIWLLDENAPVLNLQDPFICAIDDEIVFGGVETVLEQGILHYSTVFFKGKDIYHLERFAQGPRGMKDIRLTQLPQGGIGLFTRPQGVVGGRGRIGFMRISSFESLSQLKQEDYLAAPLIPGDFNDEEWLGANAIYILKNGAVGILGHIACFTSTGNPHKKSCKNYYPITFTLHAQTNALSGMKIIAARTDFPLGRSKSETLKNVLFAGGLVRHDDGTATMYVGAGDAESYEVNMADPFLEYEQDD